MIFSNELSWTINYEFLTQFILIKNCWMHSYGSDWWYVIGSCTGLVPSGIKPVPQTIFCESYDAIWPYGLNELTHNPLDKMATILADDIFKWIFLNENDNIPIQISLKLVPRSPIDNKPELIQAMAWHRTGYKPLPETMSGPSSLTHICGTRGRWVESASAPKRTKSQ